MMQLLITAFTAFDRFAVNPSALLAVQCGRPFVLVEVAYEAVDEFVASLNAQSFDRAVLMGVAGNSSNFRLETLARNCVGPIPDVRGFVPPGAMIDVSAPAFLAGTLWPADLLSHPPGEVVASNDAGGYLCNYLYFRMLQRFAGKSIGFLHVPPLEKVDLYAQLEVVASLLAVIES